MLKKEYQKIQTLLMLIFAFRYKQIEETS